ncbi:MAG: TspO/MBR family protein [Candidatus Woesearchaeota archaeon]
MKQNKFNTTLKFFFSIGVPLVAGYIGSSFTTPNIKPWYDALEKPPLTAPGSLIGAIWTILYIMMGIALFLVWSKELSKNKNTKEKEYRKKGLWVFAIQLLFNMSWSFFFFGLRNPWLGIVIIIPLLMMIALNIYFFHKIDKIAAYLLIPYILWVCFATYLNLGIAVLN